MQQHLAGFRFNNMKWSVMFIVFATVVPKIFAQSTFQTLISKDTASFSFPSGSIIEANNGDIYAVGSSYPDGHSKMRLVKLNNNGDLYWDTTYSFTPKDEFFSELMPAIDGGVILACSSYSYPLADEDSLEDILVWKINEVGDIEWQKVLSARTFIDMNITKDGGYILTASIHESAHFQGLDIITYKIDQFGEIIWSLRLGKDKADLPWDWEEPISIYEIDSTIYVCAYHQLTDEPTKSDGLLYSISAEGDINWSIFLPNTVENKKTRINSVFKFDRQYYFNGPGLFEFNPKTGSYWEVVDSLNIGVIGTLTTGYNFQVDCGINKITVVEFMPDGYFHLRLYDNLIKPYYDVVIDTITGSLTEIVKAKDGGVIALSTTTNQTMQITKTDCLGNIGFWSDDCNSKIPPNQNILVYPNPSPEEILIEATFDFDEVMIYAVNGAKTIYSNACSCPRQTLDISSLAAGVYVVRISNSERHAITRFVKI